MRGLILLFFLAFAVTGIFAQSITINKQNTSIKSKGIFSLGELYVYKGDIYVVRTGATETDLLKFNKSDLSLEKERLLGNPYTQNIEDPYFMDDGIYVIVKTSDAQRLATYNLKIFDFNLELKQEIKLPDYQEMAGSNTLYTAFYKSPKTDYFYFLVYENAAPIYYSVMADKYGNNTSQDIFSSTTDHVTTYKLKDNGEIISRFDYHVQDKDMEDIRLWVFSSYDETVLVNDWILFRYTYSEDKKYGLVGWGYIDVQTGDVKQLGDAFGKEYNISTVDFKKVDNKTKAFGSFYTEDPYYTSGAMMAELDEVTYTWTNFKTIPFPRKLSEILPRNDAGEYKGYEPTLCQVADNGNMLFYDRVYYEPGEGVKNEYTGFGEKTVLLLSIQLVDKDLNVIYEETVRLNPTDLTEIEAAPYYMEDMNKIFVIVKDAMDKKYESKQLGMFTSKITQNDMVEKLFVFDLNKKSVSFSIVDKKIASLLTSYHGQFRWRMMDGFQYLGNGHFINLADMHVSDVTIE